MEPEIKDIFFLFSINQKTGIIRNRPNMNSLLFYASLFELASKNMLTINDGHWHFSEMHLGDPVLEKVMRILVPREGKKTQAVLSRIPFQINRLFSMQVDHMKANKLIMVREITFLGMKLGYRFRIKKPDQMKPFLLKLERVLVYGRDPDTFTHILTLLLGVTRQLNGLFQGNEIRKRVRKRYLGLGKTPVEHHAETCSVIFKKLREALKAH